MRVFNRRGNRIRPLLNIHGEWKTGESTYPETLSVAMADGRVVRYFIGTQPVKLYVGKNGWQKTGREAIGYQYKKPKRMTSSLRLRCYPLR